MTDPINIILVDDHQIILDGLVEMIGHIPEFNVVGAFNKPSEVLKYIEKKPVEIIITDLEMGKDSGEDLLLKVKAYKPSIKVLVLTMHEEKSIIVQLLKNGADVYILKSAVKAMLVKAINEIASGSKFFPQNIIEIMVSEEKKTFSYHPQLKGLTNREKEILILIAEGLSSKEIGDKLFISDRTVDTHRSNLMKKLEVNNLASLIKIAFETELLG